MTEKNRGSNLLRARGLYVLGLDGDAWPDSLTAEELALLWHQRDGKEVKAMLEMLSEAIGNGSLRTCGTRLMPGHSAYEPPYEAPAFDREALAAWLGDDEPPELVRAWLGTEWPVKGSEAPSLTAWEAMSPEEKRAAWLAMTPEGRREKAPELLAKHGGNKTAAGAEVGISGNGLRHFLKDAEPEKSEAPLPVNPYTVGLGLVKPKRGKASG